MTLYIIGTYIILFTILRYSGEVAFGCLLSDRPAVEVLANRSSLRGKGKYDRGESMSKSLGERVFPSPQNLCGIRGPGQAFPIPGVMSVPASKRGAAAQHSFGSCVKKLFSGGRTGGRKGGREGDSDFTCRAQAHTRPSALLREEVHCSLRMVITANLNPERDDLERPLVSRRASHHLADHGLG
jgi:hypothetical protein